jgi:DNA-directed RNA polymerase specialized sigma24 family protein
MNPVSFAVKVEREDTNGPLRSSHLLARGYADASGASAHAHEELRGELVTGLRRALSRRGVSDDLLEDFAHDAMVRIREHLDDFRGDSRFTTWALSIAVRVAFDELRHARWRDVSFEALRRLHQHPRIGRRLTDLEVPRRIRGRGRVT